MPVINKSIRHAVAIPHIFGFPGGKKRLAPVLSKIIGYTPHETYVESFLGGGAVLWAKKQSAREVISDIDRKLMDVYRAVKNGVCCNLTPDLELWKRVKGKPKAEREPCDTVYLTSYSFGRQGLGPSPADLKRGFKKYENDPCFTVNQKRLEGVEVLDGDFRAISEKYDSPETLHYWDPPYAQTTKCVYEQFGGCDVTPREVADAMRQMKGKVVVTYDDTPDVREAFKDFHIQEVEAYYSIMQNRAVVKPGWKQPLKKQLIITNFPLKKTLRDDFDLVVYAESLQSPLCWPGGKSRIAEKVAHLIPPHKVYVEPFAGSGAVFFAKEPAEVNVLNDLDKGLMDFFSQLASSEEPLACDMRPSKDRFNQLKTKENKDVCDYLYLNHFSYGCKPREPLTYGQKARQLKCSTAEDATNCMITGVAKNIDEIRSRLRKAKLERRDFREVIAEHDSPETFFYLDPAYVSANAKECVYNYCEGTPKQVADAVRNIQGKALISYDDTPEVREAFKGFHILNVDMPGGWSLRRATYGRKQPHELLIANFPLG